MLNKLIRTIAMDEKIKNIKHLQKNRDVMNRVYDSWYYLSPVEQEKLAALTNQVDALQDDDIVSYVNEYEKTHRFPESVQSLYTKKERGLTTFESESKRLYYRITYRMGEIMWERSVVNGCINRDRQRIFALTGYTR